MNAEPSHIWQPDWQFRGRVDRIIDGDSLYVVLDQGLDNWCRVELRLVDVHAPEAGQPGHAETTAAMQAWCNALPDNLRWPLRVRTERTTVTEPGSRRSLNRYLAWIYDIAGEDNPTTGNHTHPCLNTYLAAWLARRPEYPPGR